MCNRRIRTVYAWCGCYHTYTERCSHPKDDDERQCADETLARDFYRTRAGISTSATIPLNVEVVLQSCARCILENNRSPILKWGCGIPGCVYEREQRESRVLRNVDSEDEGDCAGHFAFMTDGSGRYVVHVLKKIARKSRGLAISLRREKLWMVWPMQVTFAYVALPVMEPEKNKEFGFRKECQRVLQYTEKGAYNQGQRMLESDHGIFWRYHRGQEDVDIISFFWAEKFGMDTLWKALVVGPSSGVVLKLYGPDPEQEFDSIEDFLRL